MTNEEIKDWIIQWPERRAWYQRFAKGAFETEPSRWINAHTGNLYNIPISDNPLEPEISLSAIKGATDKDTLDALINSVKVDDTYHIHRPLEHKLYDVGVGIYVDIDKNNEGEIETANPLDDFLNEFKIKE